MAEDEGEEKKSGLQHAKDVLGIAGEASKGAEFVEGLVTKLVDVTEGEISFKTHHIHTTKDTGKVKANYKRSDTFHVVAEKYISNKRYGLYVPWYYEFAYGERRDLPNVFHIVNFKIHLEKKHAYHSNNWYCKCTTSIKREPTCEVDGDDAAYLKFAVEVAIEAGRKVGKPKMTKYWTIDVSARGKAKVT